MGSPVELMVESKSWGSTTYDYTHLRFWTVTFLVFMAFLSSNFFSKDLATFNSATFPTNNFSQTLFAGTNMHSVVNPFRSTGPRLPVAPRADTPGNPRRIRMCLMLPTKSIPLDEKLSPLREQIENAPLFSVALASILDTSEEFDNLEYLLLVAYNHDDFLFGRLEGRQIAEEVAVATMGERTNVHMLFRPVYMTSGTTVIWNILAGWGYDIGCDYFVPANDDLLWRSPGWALSAVAELRGREDPCPNFGIVGLSDETYPGFPTFHVTSRLHVYIHSRAYYPVKLLGFGVDPWIYYSYDSVSASVFSQDIVVINRVSFF
jgi:hypothetical protein